MQPGHRSFKVAQVTNVQQSLGTAPLVDPGRGSVTFSAELQAHLDLALAGLSQPTSDQIPSLGLQAARPEYSPRLLGAQWLQHLHPQFPRQGLPSSPGDSAPTFPSQLRRCPLGLGEWPSPERPLSRALFTQGCCTLSPAPQRLYLMPSTMPHVTPDAQ